MGTDILTCEKEDLQALAERQYQIGSIHSRIGIPAEAVRGARQLKAGLIENIVTASPRGTPG
jgi:diguanylate cyclase